MTERIQHIVNEISQKTKALHKQLIEEREKNSSLQAEIKSLNENEKVQTEKEVGYLKEISDLKLQLEETKSQIVEVSNPSLGRKDEEIDELVKEIEYCISQLKK